MVDSSGSSTPVSSTVTLSAPSSPVLQKSYRHFVQQDVFSNPRIQASNVIEFIASRSTSTLYVYDLAEQVGFGNLSRLWMRATGSAATVIGLQTRAGAGLSIIGRLSEGTSRETVKGAILTAFTTPCGLSVMAQSLSILPPASRVSRLVIQVPTVISVGETFALSPSLAPLATTLSILPKHITVLLSATPQESVDLAALSYKLTESHVIHLFDHYSCSRETGHPIKAPVQSQDDCFGLNVAEALSKVGYAPFDYVGGENAQTVLVILNGPLALAAKLVAANAPGLGVVVVRMLRPWLEADLLQILPSTARQVHVLDDVPNTATQGSLYVDVLGALLDSAATVHGHHIVPDRTQEYLSKPASFSNFISSVISHTNSSISLDSPTNRKLLFFSVAHSPLSALPHIIQEAFLRNHATSTRLLTDHDIYSKSGNITVDRMLLSYTLNDNLPIPIALPLAPSSQGESDFLGVFDHTLLKSHSVLQYAKPGSGVLVVTPWSAAEFAASVPPDVLCLILERGLRVYLIDAKDIATKLVGGAIPAHDAMYTLIVHLVFLRLYLGEKASESLVHQAARFMFKDVIQGISLTKINAHAWIGLVELEIPAKEIIPVTVNAPLKEYEFNAIVPDFGEGDLSAKGARLGSWHDAARYILFPSVFTPPTPVSLDKYPQNPALRPEITDRTYLVTCTVNRRLTPLEYDRNVFHLEFDTSGTGLTYAIGEALGVHGWNDEPEVLDFCAWYGVDPERLITIPIAGSSEDSGRMHTRTVLQALQQQIDLFGRPPKAFYTDLSAYATSPAEKLALQFIGSPEGNATFKKLSEKDTVTFADILGSYPSARPGIENLCEMVGDIKPRHYSIASAQAAVGDRVDLLVVTVEWLTPNGTLRYGQCTRYLDSLKVGQKVTVSIKPSVMKLPPSHLQPIIMAGLGTGAAPFRAFLQYRAWIAQQGIPVGPMFYYFGSRHQSQEYLYGEEIEAYILDGTITKAGLAFSRDGRKKVYIQHKMLEDAEVLAGMLLDEAGVFYLCGPTWPVPDIYEALVGAFVKYKGQSAVAAGEYLESLKEEERYVLEVY